MGNKEECPICKAYSSDIYSAFENHDSCPRCHTSYESILQLKELEQKKKYYKSMNVENELIEENEALRKELIIKRDRYEKMKDILWNMYYQMEKLKEDLHEEYFNKMKEWEQ